MTSNLKALTLMGKNDGTLAKESKKRLITEDRFPSEKNLDLARRGDAGAISQIFERYYQGIYQYLCYRIGDNTTAEDLTSEVFIHMVKGLSGYRYQKDCFQGWLFSIARNIAIDHFRKNRAHPLFPLEESLRSNDDPPEKTIEKRYTSEVLKAALGKLQPDQRDVIVLRIVVGLSLEETAQALRKSVDAVKGLQRRALTGLNHILTQWKISYD